MIRVVQTTKSHFVWTAQQLALHWLRFRCALSGLHAKDAHCRHMHLVIALIWAHPASEPMQTTHRNALCAHNGRSPEVIAGEVANTRRVSLEKTINHRLHRPRHTQCAFCHKWDVLRVFSYCYQSVRVFCSKCIAMASFLLLNFSVQERLRSNGTKTTHLPIATDDLLILTEDALSGLCAVICSCFHLSLVSGLATDQQMKASITFHRCRHATTSQLFYRSWMWDFVVLNFYCEHRPKSAWNWACKKANSRCTCCTIGRSARSTTSLMCGNNRRTTR